jgi:hypothetical protein
MPKQGGPDTAEKGGGITELSGVGEEGEGDDMWGPRVSNRREREKAVQ